MGCPVITTSVGAAGFCIVNGRHAMIADTPELFRAAVHTLIASRELRADMGSEGREMILDNFTWNRIGRQFLDLVEEGALP